MKISFIVSSFPSLSETFILNQVTGLVDAGHQVSIFAGARSSEACAHGAVVRYGLTDLTRVYNDKPVSRIWRALAFLLLFPYTLVHAPVPALRSLDFWRYGREALSLNLFFRMRAFLRSRHDEIVVCHFGPNGLTGVQMKELGALTGKMLVFFHAADLTSYVRRHGPGVYAELFKKADLCLAISEDARERLVALGCPAQKTAVHRMGVDVEFFSLSKARTFPAAVPIKVLSIARLVEKKGIIYAIEAMADLVSDGTVSDYTVVGDGFLREALMNRARELGVSARVHFVLAQDADRVRDFIREADIVLAPGIVADNGDEEGIPVVLMEAMAMGRLVITTPTGGISELVVDGQNGFLVPSKDPGAIAGKIRAVARAPVLAGTLARAGRATIEKKHDIRKLNRTLETIFQNLVITEAGA